MHPTLAADMIAVHPILATGVTAVHLALPGDIAGSHLTLEAGIIMCTPYMVGKQDTQSIFQLFWK